MRIDIELPELAFIWLPEESEFTFAKLIGRTVDMVTNATTYLCERYDETTFNADQEDIYPWVGFYTIDRRYGGGEEGGWWYDWSDHLCSFPASHFIGTGEGDLQDANANARDRMAKALSAELGIGTYPLHSVLSDGEVGHSLEHFPGSEQSTERPHYE